MNARGTAKRSEPRAEHFLPLALHDLFEALLSDEEPGQREELRELFRLYVRLFHARQRALRDRLERAYAPLRPDEDLLDLTRMDPGQRAESRRQLLQDLDAILCRANYLRLSQAELEAALGRRSPYGLEVSVNLDDYEELRLYTRGRGREEVRRRSWKSAFTREETSEAALYRRLFLIIALEPEELHLKLFRDFPETDLEMLLPNTRVRIRAFDKVKLGVTGGGGALGTIFSAVTKLGATFNPVTAGLAIAGLAGVVWRQVASVLAQRTKYLAALKSKLYFHSLDNNQGALNHLVELAGEEECKEALLAYAFLRREPSDRARLDARVEGWLQERFGLRVDYEVSDGLRKLEQEGLLESGEPEALRVLPPEPALERLQRAWSELGAPRAGRRVASP